MEDSSAAAARFSVRPARFELQLTSTLGLALRGPKLDTWVAAWEKRQEEPALCMQALQTLGRVHSRRGLFLAKLPNSRSDSCLHRSRDTLRHTIERTRSMRSAAQDDVTPDVTKRQSMSHGSRRLCLPAKPSHLQTVRRAREAASRQPDATRNI